MDPIKILKQKTTDTGWQFKVVVGTPPDQTKHRVTLSNEYWQQLTDGQIAADQLVIKSFEFLLARESKESILPSFDLTVIKKYFPEFESDIK